MDGHGRTPDQVARILRGRELGLVDMGVGHGRLAAASPPRIDSSRGNRKEFRSSGRSQRLSPLRTSQWMPWPQGSRFIGFDVRRRCQRSTAYFVLKEHSR